MSVPSVFRGISNFLRYRPFTSIFQAPRFFGVVGSALRELHPLLENTHAHEILERDPKYAKTTFSVPAILKALPKVSKEEADSILKDTNWSEVSLDEVCQRFRKISAETHSISRIPFTSKRYEGMYQGVLPRLGEMSDDQIAEVLLSLSVWPLTDSPRSQPFNSFWTQIDLICLDRKSTWDKDKVLSFIDLWHILRLTRISNFTYQSMLYLGKKPSLLSAPQLIQVLFYFNAMRTAHKGLAMYNLEHRLEQVASDLTLNELGIACLGFFKTQTTIRSEALLKYIMDRLLSEISTAEEIVIAAVLKAVRLSIPITLWPQLPRFLDAIEPQVDRMSLQSAIHLGLVTTKSRTLHPSSLTKVTEKVLANFSQTRLKDLEKILYPLTLLAFEPMTTPCIFQKTLEELDNPEREEEFIKYPRTLIAILHYLALRGIFHRKLIHKVLDIGYIRNVYGKNNFTIGREILSIDTCVEIDCSNYKGNRLPPSVQNYLSKRYSLFLPEEGRKLSKHGQFMLDIIKHTKAVLGEDMMSCKYIVPNQSRADIVFALDDANRPISLPSDFRTQEEFTGTIPAPKGARWKCVVVITKNLCVFESDKLTGETVTKLRHLKALGYELILVYSSEWIGDTETKMKLLQDKIFT